MPRPPKLGMETLVALAGTTFCGAAAGADGAARRTPVAR